MEDNSFKIICKINTHPTPANPKIRKGPISAQNRRLRCKLQLFDHRFIIRALEIGIGVEAGNAVDKKWSLLSSCNWFIDCNKLMLWADYFRSQYFFLCISRPDFENRGYSNNLHFSKLFSTNLPRTGFRGCSKGLIP